MLQTCTDLRTDNLCKNLLTTWSSNAQSLGSLNVKERNGPGLTGLHINNRRNNSAKGIDICFLSFERCDLRTSAVYVALTITKIVSPVDMICLLLAAPVL